MPQCAIDAGAGEPQPHLVAYNGYQVDTAVQVGPDLFERPFDGFRVDGSQVASGARGHPSILGRRQLLVCVETLTGLAAEVTRGDHAHEELGRKELALA